MTGSHVAYLSWSLTTRKTTVYETNRGAFFFHRVCNVGFRNRGFKRVLDHLSELHFPAVFLGNVG